MHKLRTDVFLAAGLAAAWVCGGCGENAGFLNPAFINYTQGGLIALTPGPSSDFVLVRAVNKTQLPVEFILTVEREAVVDPLAGGADQPADTQAALEKKTFRLQTFSGGLTSEIGILLDCPMLRVGLGEALEFPFDEPGLFVGTATGNVVQGYGVPAGVYPLDTRTGNFTCGDTVVFEAREQVGVPGNVSVLSFVLPAATQPPTVSGPDTFNNSRILLEREYAEEE